LTPRQRQELAALATRLSVPARGLLYRQEAVAAWIFICAGGAAKAYRDLPSGRRALCAFLFKDDMFGLAERGRYVNTVQAITPVTCFRIPLEPLLVILDRDAKLGLQFLYKISHELREAQKRAILIGRRSAPGRVAMFLQMLMAAGPTGQSDIEIPMSRRDIADYVGLSPEAVSRATHRLEKDGVVAFPSVHSARILDRRRFETLAGDL
jgi:CRP/FNR family transcriptional regulator